MPTHRLWTPIANALEAYRRRVVVEPEAEYEHIWRLIHIQEALAVSLASLMATRLAYVADDDASRGTLRVLKETLTGLRPNPAGASDDDDVEPSPWGGSIGAWIEMLRRFGRSSVPLSDPFLSALSGYLVSSPDRPLAFADAWSRIAPVAATFRDPALDRVGRLGAINSFRNKLAHVPVSQRLLGDLHRGLRVEVLDGLTDRFNPETDANALGFVATSYREPLTGVLYFGDSYVTGGSEVGIDPNRSSTSTTLLAAYGRPNSAVEWPVEPFFRLDREAKTALLFRVSDLHHEPGATGYGGEYHRFAAELEPVTYVAIAAEAVEPWIPDSQPPVQPPQAAPEEPQQGQDVGEPRPLVPLEPERLDAESSFKPDPSPRDLRWTAEKAFAIRDYRAAVAAYEKLAQFGQSTEYNDVARSKHGAALWRVAERTSSGLERIEGLQKSVSLLRRAERHRDPLYAARSAYEGSKALWNLWRATSDTTHLLDALAAAERAVARSLDEAFIGWQARVKRDVEMALPQGVSEPTPRIAIGVESDPHAVDRLADVASEASSSYGRKGRYKDAVAAAEAALRVNPAHLGALRSLATNLSQMGQHERAREAWRALDSATGLDSGSASYDSLLDARTDWASASAWDLAARSYDREGRGADVIAEARQVLAVHPEAHPSLVPVAEWFTNALPELSLALITDMRGIAPDSPHYIHLAGVAKRKAGRNHDALVELREACDLAPGNPNYWYALGRCLEDLEQFDPACQAFEKALAVDDGRHLKAREHLSALKQSGRC